MSNQYYLPPDSQWHPFEASYPHFDVRKWTIENRHLSIVFGAIYLLLVLVGRKIMKNRQPFAIRRPLATWNAFMFLLSFTIFVRLAAYSIKRAIFTPLFNQVCTAEFEEKPLVFWLDLFVLTKPIEFVDTLFIVLRKQPLHFLHWYHHCTVVILCWYSLGIEPVPPKSLYYASMNSFIHTIMYLYYFVRSLRIILPRPLQMAITGLQIAQMAVGCILNISALIYRAHQGRKCDAAYESIGLALGIYLCYFILFADYFYKVYFTKQKSKVDTVEKANGHLKEFDNNKINNSSLSNGRVTYALRSSAAKIRTD